jgi:hypothetical protein
MWNRKAAPVKAAGLTSNKWEKISAGTCFACMVTVYSSE